jgi:hypothetical protein
MAGALRAVCGQEITLGERLGREILRAIDVDQWVGIAQVVSKRRAGQPSRLEGRRGRGSDSADDTAPNRLWPVPVDVHAPIK